MTTWSAMPDYPGYEVSDAGRMRSIGRQVPVPFRQARTLGTITADEIAQHPHTTPREIDSMGTVIPPTVPVGPAIANVMDFGAVGNGIADDTAAFNDAYASLPSIGGTVYAPNNTYLIDAEVSIKPRSKTRLDMDLEAFLQAKTTSNDKYAVIAIDKVSDVEIVGGNIIGERATHTGVGGEAGHGIRVHGGVRITVRDINISECWGDAMSIGAWKVGTDVYSEDVFIQNMVASHNRRNGLSIGNVIGCKVYDSIFRQTDGTSPKCGIDIEPDNIALNGGTCKNVIIENCDIYENATYGMNIFNRVWNVTLKNCRIGLNNSLGIQSVGCNGLTVDGCLLYENGNRGLQVASTSAVVVVFGNTFRENSGHAPRIPPIEKAGIVSGTKNDIVVNAATKDIGVNRYE